MKIVIDTWAPDYGTSNVESSDEPVNKPQVDVDCEMPGHSWEPITVTAAPAETVMFVDGIRRVDARIWVVNGDEASGIAASFAAGAVLWQNKSAELVHHQVKRHIFTRVPIPPIVVGGGNFTYEFYNTPGGDTDLAMQLLQQCMGKLEQDVADEASNEHNPELVVIDGPLSGRAKVANTVGYIKTHHKHYLDIEQNETVEQLLPGQRTPIFNTRTNHIRWSWYMRLPVEMSERRWEGIVRCEADNKLTLPEVQELADRATTTIPTFASRRYRDPRAPQNLSPIGSLEQRLRHMLGEPAIIERMLRKASVAA